jgi:hypothetical protein
MLYELHPLTLKLKPHHEKQFWASPVYQQATAAADYWAFFERFLHNLLYLRAYRTLPSSLALERSHLFGLAVAAAHLLCRFFLPPATYHRMRWTLIRQCRSAHP